MTDLPNRKTADACDCDVCGTAIPAGAWIAESPAGDVACSATCVATLLEVADPDDALQDEIGDLEDEVAALEREQDRRRTRGGARMTAPTLDQIYPAVNRVTTIGRYFIRSAARQPAIVHARAVTVAVLRQHGWTWEQIAAELNRSHSSVLELHRDHQHRPELKKDVAAVSETLNAQFCTTDRKAVADDQP